MYIIANIYLLAVCNFVLLPIGYLLHSFKKLSVELNLTYLFLILVTCKMLLSTY